MTNADAGSPQYCPPVPDTAMATGSEDGEPGEQPDEPPLRPDERAVLTDLAGSADKTKAVEDSPAVARAAKDDSVLPVDAGSHGDENDPLTPEFPCSSVRLTTELCAISVHL
ncbi:MAG TPA: hypothetical protein VNA67_10685 [Pseudonocardiaceae bacterium]|nr:hypothetical protein [Pseudonocardiaceae bacterium]